ncbi:2Fe-2S iron-sulfur cluster-binding protein [sulfur-oxidizing endosymbiont of Gigantopelta aegis]|uniref:2Fe-2S iron-sulfur cluster-binding protein n=1 Tax=sulfur-oxidizing endosymbiont of Gigantopelta aegis TaxID=2794934 RepID=UPI0018DD4140|nr:2Fe-2S iron-sulfur cluster-binding protein [sulfur-oxidizing endosymbiont of Gigantopelta aegis]
MPTYTFKVCQDVNHKACQTYPLERAQSIFKNLQLQGVSTQSKCGGKALCGGCRIQILSDNKYCNAPVAEEKSQLSSEQLAQGWRLSCQLYSLRDIEFSLPVAID